MKYKNEITVILFISVIVVLGVYFFSNFIKKAPTPQPVLVNVPEPAKTEFGTRTPADFPTNIPVETDAKVNQSYSLDYRGKKQLTIVFPSARTVKQNYATYTEFLNKDGWNILNTYEGGDVSSIYGTKDNNDINVTLTSSQVSISILKK